MKTKPLYGNIIDHSQHMNLTVYENLLEFHSSKLCILLRFPQSSLWILVLFFRRQTQPWISVDFSPSGCWPVMFPWGCTVGGAVMANNSVSSAASYDLFGASAAVLSPLCSDECTTCSRMKTECFSPCSYFFQAFVNSCQSFIGWLKSSWSCKIHWT